MTPTDKPRGESTPGHWYANAEPWKWFLTPKEFALFGAAPDLLADLREAAVTLRRYEDLHRAKGSIEADAKADANAALATRFEKTIRRATGAQS